MGRARLRWRYRSNRGRRHGSHAIPAGSSVGSSDRRGQGRRASCRDGLAPGSAGPQNRSRLRTVRSIRTASRGGAGHLDPSRMTPQCHGKHPAQLREGEDMTRKSVVSDQLPAVPGPYSHAIVAGGVVFCSGTAGIDAATGTVRDGIEAQTEQRSETLRPSSRQSARRRPTWSRQPSASRSAHPAPRQRD